MKRWDRESTLKIIRKKQYFKLSQRLSSFLKFDISKKIRELANSGYRYSPGSNFVVCHNCYTRDYNFLSNRKPDIHHGKVSPNCNVLKRKNSEEWTHDNFYNNHEDYEPNLFVCKICNNRKVAYYSVPCQHSIACERCYYKTPKRCPYCQLTIKHLRKIFI